MSRYHCCATCIHFRVEKGKGTSYVCSRIGYATKPVYQFQCWTPKEAITKRMDSERTKEE